MQIHAMGPMAADPDIASNCHVAAIEPTEFSIPVIQ